MKISLIVHLSIYMNIECTFKSLFKRLRDLLDSNWHKPPLLITLGYEPRGTSRSRKENINIIVKHYLSGRDELKVQEGNACMSLSQSLCEVAGT
jgi:hypothetical protein